jgi:hypothetical protein
MKKNYLLMAFCIVAFSLNAQNKQAAVGFDGVDDYILVEHDNSLNLGRSAFTIEAWITASPNLVTNGTQAPMVISKKGASGTAKDGFLFGLNNTGKIALEMEGVTFTPGFGGFGAPGVKAIDLRDGVCHHMAWVREVGGVEDTVVGYQDGQMVRKTRNAAGKEDIQNTEDLWIGWSEDFTTPNLYQFEGNIKEIRIWNYARTQAEIDGAQRTHLVGNEPGLIAYWRLNEYFGQTVYDCSSNQNNGVQKNGAHWASFICDNMTGPTPNCVNGPPLGLDEAELTNNITLYPNPSSTEIRLQHTGNIVFDNATIIDLNGRTVMQEKWSGLDALNIESLNKGTYILVISSGNNLVYRTMVTKE